MQPKFILQCKKTLKLMNVRCFEVHEKPRRRISLYVGQTEFWAEGTQDSKDIFYCLVSYTFWFLSLLNIFNIHLINKIPPKMP